MFKKWLKNRKEKKIAVLEAELEAIQFIIKGKGTISQSQEERIIDIRKQLAELKYVRPAYKKPCQASGDYSQ